MDTPPIQLSEGGSFQPRGAWTDLYEAICNAQHLIYIAGWSVYDKIKLIRDPCKPMVESEIPSLGKSFWHSPKSEPAELLLMATKSVHAPGSDSE